MRIRFSRAFWCSVVLLVLTPAAAAGPVVYDLVAEVSPNGSTLTGSMTWDSAITTPTTENATWIEVEFTPGPGVLVLPQSYSQPGGLDQSGLRLWFLGSVGDAELVQNCIPVAAVEVTFGNVTIFSFIELGCDLGSYHPAWLAATVPGSIIEDGSNGALDGPEPDWKLVLRPATVPLPGAFWLGTGMLALLAAGKRLRRRR